MRSVRAAPLICIYLYLAASSASSVAGRTPVDVTFCESFSLRSDVLDAGTPAEWSEASKLLLQAFPSDARKAFLEQGGVLPECATTQFELRILEALQAKWNLGSDGNPLTADLVSLGYRSPAEQVRILLAGAYSVSQKEQLDRVVARRAKFLADEDLLSPRESIPPDCRAKYEERSSMRVINGYSRALRWVVCDDASIRIYLWERGWFLPLQSDLRMLCVDAVGDEEAICSSWKDDE